MHDVTDFASATPAPATEKCAAGQAGINERKMCDAMGRLHKAPVQLQIG